MITRGPGLQPTNARRFHGVWLERGDPTVLWLGWHPRSGVVWLDPSAPAGMKIGRALTPWGASRRIRQNRQQ